ncbi:hypothetical protein B7463_g2518, partial [Scytalidium lignicola]
MPSDDYDKTGFEQSSVDCMPSANIFASYAAEDISTSSSVECGHNSSYSDKLEDDCPAILSNNPGTLIPSPDPFSYDLDSDSASDGDTLPVKCQQLHNDIEKNNSQNTKAQELELAMYYIDSIFYIQFRFYSNISAPDRRGWLYGLLRKIKPFYNACLALSSYADAILHSKEESEIGLFRGGTGNWKIHLQAALSLLNRLIPIWLDMSPVGELSHMLTYTQCDNSTCCLAKEKLLKFSFVVLLWFEIIACASGNLTPSLFPLCKNLLESNTIDMVWATGCRNWVWLQIAEVTALLSWKNNSQRLSILSIRELTQRAMAIEKQIEEKQNEHAKLIQCGSLPLTSEINMHDVNDVTAIFSLATLTYLHVVVSGPNPNLPEIKSSVSKTLAALKGLRDPQLTRNLAWPLCVTGCLAENGDRAIVEDLMVAAGTPSKQLGNLSSTLRIIKECWRLRDHEQGLWEWKGVMAYLDEHIFLA